MDRRVPTAAPTAAGHQAPIANTFRAVIGIVEIGKAEQEMAELVSANANLAVLRHCQVSEDFRLIDSARAAIERPFVRPDVVGVAGYFTAWAGMDNNEGIHE